MSGKASASPQPYVFTQTHETGGARALRTESWALIDSARHGRQLFDRRSDPDERVDVKDAHPDVIEELEPIMRELAEGSPRKATATQAVEDEQTKAELRALGYLE